MNTAMIVRNDFLHEIKDDPKFGEKVYTAVISAGRGPYHGQAFDVLPYSHADNMQIVAIGGNSISLLGFGGGYRTTADDILRNLARSMGYRLVNMPRE